MELFWPQALWGGGGRPTTPGGPPPPGGSPAGRGSRRCTAPARARAWCAAEREATLSTGSCFLGLDEEGRAILTSKKATQKTFLRNPRKMFKKNTKKFKTRRNVKKKLLKNQNSNQTQKTIVFAPWCLFVFGDAEDAALGSPPTDVKPPQEGDRQ